MLIPCRWCQIEFDAGKNVKYCSRDCVRLANNARSRERGKRPEIKAKRAISDAKYKAKPEAKAKHRERQKRYDSLPEVKARNRERRIARMQRPGYLVQYKKRIHELKSSPAYKARREELKAMKNGRAES